MNDSQLSEPPKIAGLNKRQNRSPILQESADSTLTERQKRQKVRDQRSADMSHLEDKLDVLLKQSAANDLKLDSLLQKHEETSNKIDLLSNDISLIKLKTDSLEANQEQCRADIDWIKGEVGRLSNELSVVQQANLSNHFVFFGLPHDLPSDQALKWLQKIAHKLDMLIEKDDLKYIALRKDNARKSSYLTGIFYDTRKKQQFFDNAKLKRPLTVELVFTSLPQTSNLRGKEIVIKNQISPAIRARLSEARRLNNNVFRFIWQRNGQILMKKDEGEPVFEIRSTEQLLDVLAKNPIPHSQLSRNQQRRSQSQNHPMDTSSPNNSASSKHQQRK